MAKKPLPRPLRRDEHVVAVSKSVIKQARRYRGMGNSTLGRRINIMSDVDDAAYELQSVTLDNGEAWVEHIPDAATRAAVRQAFEACRRRVADDATLSEHVSKVPTTDLAQPYVWTKDSFVQALDALLRAYTAEVDRTKSMSRNEKRRLRAANDRRLVAGRDALVNLSLAHLNESDRQSFALLAAAYLPR